MCLYTQLANAQVLPSINHSSPNHRDKDPTTTCPFCGIEHHLSIIEGNEVTTTDSSNQTDTEWATCRTKCSDSVHIHVCGSMRQSVRRGGGGEEGEEAAQWHSFLLSPPASSLVSVPTTGVLQLLAELSILGSHQMVLWTDGVACPLSRVSQPSQIGGKFIEFHWSR